MNHEIHETHENNNRNGLILAAEDFTFRVKREFLATLHSFVYFVYFVVSTAFLRLNRLDAKARRWNNNFNGRDAALRRPVIAAR